MNCIGVENLSHKFSTPLFYDGVPCFLLFDQFDATVLCPAIFRIVRHDGRKRTAAGCSQTASFDAMVFNQFMDDHLSPALGKSKIAVHASHVIGMSYDMELQASVRLKQFGNLGDSR